MTKFCTKCGRPLQDGEICTCQQGAAVNNIGKQTGKGMPSSQGVMTPQGNQIPQEMMRQQGVQMSQGVRIQQNITGQRRPEMTQGVSMQQVPHGNQNVSMQQMPPGNQGGMMNSVPVQSQPASDYFRRLWAGFIGIITKPVTEGRNLILQADAKLAIVYILLQGIFTGLFALTVSAKCGSFIDMLIGLAGGMSSYGNNFAYANMFALPYGRIFFVTLAASVALSCILALLLMVGHLVIKNRVNYVQMLSVVSIRSILLIPVSVLAIVIFQLHVAAGIFLFFLGGIWGFVAMCLSMTSYRTDEEKNGYAGMISIVALIFVLITYFAMSKLWGYYLPDMIRMALEEVKNTISDPSVLWEEILEEIF